MPQLRVQNFYSTTATSDIITLWDTSFTVAVAPTYTSGFLVISPNNSALREIVYFHTVVGTTISVRAENRWLGGTTAKLHTSTETVAINDVAEIFNMFSDSLSQCFFIEKTGGLTVKAWGGTVFYNGNPVTVADTNLTLADNQTNYIKYSYPTNTISVDTVNSGNIKARAIVASGVITSLTYYVAKESYIDFTVAITGALPPQAWHAWKSLMTDGTIVSWGDPAVNSSATVRWVVEIATTAESKAATDTGATGATLSVLPSDIAKNIQSGSFVYWADVGWDDTYVVALIPVLAAYTTGQTLTMKVTTANTWACTVDFWPWVKSIKMPDWSDPANWTISGVVHLMYDGTNFVLQNQNKIVQNWTFASISFSYWSGWSALSYSSVATIVKDTIITLSNSTWLYNDSALQYSVDNSSYSDLYTTWASTTETKVFLWKVWYYRFRYACAFSWGWIWSSWNILYTV